MKKFIIIFLTISLLSVDIVKAQEINGEPWDMSESSLIDGKTIIKANALGWVTRNFGFYGERVINKHISAVVGINFMPKGNIPFIEKLTEDKIVKDMTIGSFAFAPEIRFYLGKSGYGRGFYIGPYYKYERFNTDKLTTEYLSDNGIYQNIALDGKLITHSVGAIIGAQWLLGKNKNIALDWTIIGAHYGTNRGVLNGFSSRPLSEQEQADLKKEIEDGINNSVFIKNEGVTVDEHSVQANIKSPWAFIRMALSVGYRF